MPRSAGRGPTDGRRAPNRPAPTVADTRPLLAGIHAGRVLDVATGRGGFVEELVGGLASFDEIVGIDLDDEVGSAFGAAFADRPDVRFVRMDALQPDFAARSFDTVTVSASLHHFADPAPILRTMQQLVRPGGRIIVAEMIRDGQTETQLTHVLLHHWWAAVDATRGVIHLETYRRAEVERLIAGLGLGSLERADVVDLAADPFDPETIAQLDRAIDRYLDLSAGQPELSQRGDELRRRLHQVGIHGATTLMFIGRV